MEKVPGNWELGKRDLNRGKSKRNSTEKELKAIVSSQLADGTLVETVFDPNRKETFLCVCQNGKIRYEQNIMTGHHRLVPYSPSNNLLKNEVVILPSEPEEYASEEELIFQIQSFIHRYVDLSPLFEKIASYYVLFSWVYDSFNELPYLRLRGEPGTGKTRFLLTAGSLCYKPIFASGASTVSPLFRLLDSIRGTLIIDEGDFRLSDEKAEIVKILNNGNARGFPVLRSEVSGKKEFNPTAYAVFGPKIVATRRYFEDRALESRCITEEMGQRRLRGDIPVTCPPTYKSEALQIRNKLLMFRFRNHGRRSSDETLVDRTIEPRLSQIFVPLLSIIRDARAREDLRRLARQYHREIIAERGMDMEAQLLEVIRDLKSKGQGQPSVKDITSWFRDRHGEDYDRKITEKWIGWKIRKKLFLRTKKSHGVFIIPEIEKGKLDRLFEKFGVTDSPEAIPEGNSENLSLL